MRVLFRLKTCDERTGLLAIETVGNVVAFRFRPIAEAQTKAKTRRAIRVRARRFNRARSLPTDLLSLCILHRSTFQTRRTTRRDALNAAA